MTTKLEKHTKVVAICVHESHQATLRTLGGSKWFRAAIADALRKAHAIRKAALQRANWDIERAKRILMIHEESFVPSYSNDAQRMYWEGVLRLARAAIDEILRVKENDGDIRAIIKSMDATDIWDIPEGSEKELPKEKPSTRFYESKTNPFL